MNLIPSYDDGIMMTGLKMMAAGLVVIVGYIILDNHFTSKEFPDITFTDSLENQRVSSISKTEVYHMLNFNMVKNAKYLGTKLELGLPVNRRNSKYWGFSFQKGEF